MQSDAHDKKNVYAQILREGGGAGGGLSENLKKKTVAQSNVRTCMWSKVILWVLTERFHCDSIITCILFSEIYNVYFISSFFFSGRKYMH